MRKLTVAYITYRKEPMISWFLDSLERELKNWCEDAGIVIIDYYADYGRKLSLPSGAFHVPPKPCVWQGKHRLTTRDYFAAANARNTALCLADSEWIAYCDDLSVLLPGWATGIQAAMKEEYVVCGAYKKVNDLTVKKGDVLRFTEQLHGIDNRLTLSHNSIISCNGGWLFGCSCAMPVEYLLSINGWDETCDGCGSEDYCTGIRMRNAGYSFKYDPRMMTYESEELHTDRGEFTRIDKGISPHDKSHKLLYAAQASKWCPNYFEEGGIRALRNKILAGDPFPIQRIPEHDFFDGQPLCEM